MAKATITVNTDDTHKDMLAKAAEAAGMSLSAYLLKAAGERLVRDAADRYRQVLAENPEFRTEVSEARQLALRNAAALRAQVMAKYGVTA